jgi:hydrophobe/amphiphile efflux-3 (HAE3) family protein
VGRFLGRRTLPVMVGVAVVTVALVPGLARLDFATGQDSYLDPGAPVAVANQRYQALFGGETMVVLFTTEAGRTVVELFTPANLAHFEEVAAQLGPHPDVDAVVTPLTALTWTQDLVLSGAAGQILAAGLAREADPAAAAARTADIGVTLARLAAAGEQTLANPGWVRFLLFANTGFEVVDGQLVAPPDDRLEIRRSLQAFFPQPNQALLAATLTGNATLDQLASGAAAVDDALAGRAFDNASFLVAGTPALLTEINDYLQGGMLTLGGLAVVVMLVVLALAFRVRWRLLPMASVVVGVVWGFGLFGYLGIDLSLVTIAGLPILIGVGIDFAIQVHNRVEEECLINRDRSPFAETLARLGPALLAATVAAVLAFSTMGISRVPMIQDFGVLLAVGIVMLLLAGVVIPLAVLGARERFRPTTTATRPGPVERTVGALGSLPRAAVVPLVVLAVTVSVVGISLEGRSPIESDPINWADPDSDSVRNARALADQTGFATSLALFIETTGVERNGVFTDEMAAFVHDAVARSLAAEADLVQASSLVTTVSYLLEVPGATALAPTAADLMAAYQVAPPDVQRLLVGPDGNSAQILFRVGPAPLEERAELIERLERSLAAPPLDEAPIPANATATPAGLAVIGVALLDNLMANRTALTVAALALVAAWLVVRYGDLARAALTMVPVLLAVGASTSVVSLLGITLSPLTTVSTPLVAATCAVFSILLVARYREERQRGLAAEAAKAMATQRTGRAFSVSALTTIGGFAVLMLAPLPLLRDFGMIVTLNVAIALVSALVVVPPLVLWADERGWFAASAPSRVPPWGHRRGWS